METTNERISISKLNAYRRCKLFYYYRYCEGLVSPLDCAQITGRAVHKSLEVFYKNKLLNNGQNLPINDVLDIYSKAFEDIIKNEETNIEGEEMGKIKDTGAACLKLYHEQIAIRTTPVLCEEKIELAFENLPGVVLVGIVDLFDSSGTLHETKVVKKSFQNDYIQGDAQLCAYQLLLKHGKNIDVKKLELNAMVKTAVPKLQLLQAEPKTQAELTRFLRLVGAVYSSMKTGIFYPNPSPLNCYSCGFKKQCSEW